MEAGKKAALVKLVFAVIFSVPLYGAFFADLGSMDKVSHSFFGEKKYLPISLRFFPQGLFI